MQEILDDENEKKWYLAKSKACFYNINNDRTDAYALNPGEITTSLTQVCTYYYKYDEQGRLTETNAGSLPSVYAMNDGTYREKGYASVIDSDVFDQREEDNNYVMYISSRGKYYYPDNIDDANTFTYEYNSDGSVLETVTRDNEVKYTNQYTFDGKFLTSQKVIFPNSQSTIYTNFKYYSDYVAFDEGVDRRYWEEACDVSGKLNGMTLEFDGDMTEFGSSYTTVKLDYYFEDSLDSFGNINMRIQKYDIEGGELGGRNLV